MKSLHISATEDTPEIHFTPGSLEIRGRSIPENAFSFWNPIVNWAKDYTKNLYPKNAIKQSILNVDLDYFNTVSAGFIFEILNALNQVAISGHKVVINWYEYSGDGEDSNYSDIFTALNFKYIEKD